MAESSNRTCTVYGLASTRDGKIRYVGQTLGRLRGRLTGHLHKARGERQTSVCAWIRSEIADGFEITIRALQEGAEHNVAEICWIAKLRRRGLDLVNSTDGGAGFHGYRMTQAHRLAIAASLAGKGKSPEHIAKVAAALAGRRPSRQTIEAARRAAKRGWSAERRATWEMTPQKERSERARQARLKLPAARRVLLASNAAKALWLKKRAEGSDCGVHMNGVKLDDARVMEIRRKRAAGIGGKALAEEYGVSDKAIWKIVTGEMWTHLPLMSYERIVMRGTGNKAAKVTEDDVRAIRNRFAGGDACAAIARDYGMEKGTITRIVYRHTWAHVA